MQWLVKVLCFECSVSERRILVGLSSKFLSRDGSKGSSTASFSYMPRTEGEILQNANLKNFSLSELKSATRNFRPDSVVGEGGFGCVFKGWIDESSLAPSKPGTGIVIAVKRLNQEGFQGHREWLVSHISSHFFSSSYFFCYFKIVAEPGFVVSGSDHLFSFFFSF